MHAAVSEATERDRDIVELLRQAGRDRAFEELLRRYEGKVYRLCRALLRDRAQAEDAAQESLIRVWKALERYDGRASLSSWIYAITRNRCLTALEKRRSYDSLDDLGEEAEAGLAVTEEPGDGRTEQLLGLVELLPKRLRRTLVLYYYEEHSVSEVALMLGCPEGTVKTLLFRARAALAEMLKRRGLDDPAYWQEGTP
ncbi:MAG TPA: sigma-70 family RNA polymerase sigma factor [Steroidobacteraceae bacterium]|jgi:RNA polymerase sigma-70 factor (ECF subfamily)